MSNGCNGRAVRVRHSVSAPCAMFSTMSAIFSGPGRFTITSVTVGAGRDLINVTFVQVSHVICDDYRLLSTSTMNIFTC